MWKSDKLRTLLSEKRNIFILYIIVSICILFLALGGREKTKTPPETENAAAPLEAVLENALSHMRGVENPSVNVTYESGPETVVAKNKNGDR